jgi:hypothetical protein
MGAGSTQGPLGTSPVPPIDPGTNALTAAPNTASVGTTPPAAAGTPASPAAATPAADAADQDPDIEALNLTGNAKKGAYALKKKHSSVTFTSGKRGKDDQARAMAGNVVENRKWIEETYVETDIRKKLQKWVDDNEDKKTKDEIKEGLLSVLNDATDAQLATLSKHLSGEAFDVQPVETDAEEIKTTIRGLEKLDKFLEKEGGLVRWHAQFKA